MTALPAITAAQVCRARALLRWTTPRLARTAAIGFDKALKAQDDETMSTLSFMDVSAIRSALEEARVRFEADAAGRPTAVLSKLEP